MSPPFDKPATTYDDQLDLLRGRGMLIVDPTKVRHLLGHLNFYRLRAYFVPFLASGSGSQFRTGTTFDEVISIYEFDRELRLLLLDAIERIEISVRSHWAYEMAHRHGPHGYLQEILAKDHDYWASNCQDLGNELNRSSEPFISELRRRYAERFPPAWAACEVMSFGLLSRWYSNLGPATTRQAIADPFQLDDSVLQSWLRHLTHVRNFCAHHCRVWNRDFTVTPKVPVSKPPGLGSQFHTKSRRIYNTVILILHLLDRSFPGHTWRPRMYHYLTSSQSAPHLTQQMGFPKGWEKAPIWKL